MTFFSLSPKEQNVVKLDRVFKQKLYLLAHHNIALFTVEHKLVIKAQIIHTFLTNGKLEIQVGGRMQARKFFFKG